MILENYVQILVLLHNKLKINVLTLRVYLLKVFL
jgi:hypothetical protein